MSRALEQYAVKVGSIDGINPVKVVELAAASPLSGFTEWERATLVAYWTEHQLLIMKNIYSGAPRLRG